MDIQEQIFQRLLADGNPLILEPFQARALAYGRAEKRTATPQAHVAMRLQKRDLQPIKVGGRWVFLLTEIARWLAAGGASAPSEPRADAGPGWGKRGRPSNAERAARAAAAR